MKTEQFSLFRNDEIQPTIVSIGGATGHEARAIEQPDFPFEVLSDIAEIESWRKEINRPIYHVHKWWAQRLGSVFRAIVLGAFAPAGSGILDLFYSAARLPGVIVFDPFMGSGTTIGETLKLGARAIGRDINPVAYSLVRNGLGLPQRDELIRTFHSIEHDVAGEIEHYYRAVLPDGRSVQVLYYFWVKQVACPHCKSNVELFSSYVFAQHAYPKHHPDARAVCPACGEINVIRYDAPSADCTFCRTQFAPASGPAHGYQATCRQCNETFPIAKVVRERGKPPDHRLYAKLVVTPAGEKKYLKADDFDRSLYEEAVRQLADLPNVFPVVEIQPGYNTKQVLNYSYRYWHEMFNARQLLCLSLLADRITRISDAKQREFFCSFFSGVLEFNNMFTSFKGEGTGAVRHMFHHHILKPERTPLEANVWGTRKSSGSFSTLFQTRVLRALEYAENPFEVRVKRANGVVSGEKVFGLSLPLFHDAAMAFEEFRRGSRLYLSCGDSANTDLDPESIDAVITDPPFFDNVHYSELADFFYVWQRQILGHAGHYTAETTRSAREVQASDAEVFRKRLTDVWRECHRVLRANGLLVFTYHHSRSEGWRCLLASLFDAGFAVVQTHPIKAEMSVATPKHQAKEPIDLDVILVCRKRPSIQTARVADWQLIVREAAAEASDQVGRLSTAGRGVSRNDIRVVVMAQVIARLSRLPDDIRVLQQFDAIESSAEQVIEHLNGRSVSGGNRAETEYLTPQSAKPC